MGPPEHDSSLQDERDDQSRSGNATDSSPEGPGPSVSYGLFECQVCSSIVLGIHEDTVDLSCHGEPMEPIEEDGIDHTEPDIEQLLTDVYGAPQMMMDVCHFIFEAGTATVAETADHFEYDRSTVSRYLKQLSELGFLERHTLNREEGGEVYVYEARPLEETRRAELVSFLHWSGKATLLLDEANEIKAECADREEPLDTIFWEVYEELRTKER